MEEKNIALCMLGIIAITAITGMIMIFTSEKTMAETTEVVAEVVIDPYTEKPMYKFKERPAYGVGPGVKYRESGEKITIEPANLPVYYYETVNLPR